MQGMFSLKGEDPGGMDDERQGKGWATHSAAGRVELASEEAAEGRGGEGTSKTKHFCF
jgi:hypothetical protein